MRKDYAENPWQGLKWLPENSVFSDTWIGGVSVNISLRGWENQTKEKL